MKSLLIWTLLFISGSAYSQTSNVYQVQQGINTPSYYDIYKPYTIGSVYNMSTYTVINRQTLKVETYNVSRTGDQYSIQQYTSAPSYDDTRKKLGKTSDLYMNTKRKN